MNNELFEWAYGQYQLNQYHDALMAFTDCLQDPDAAFAPGEIGLLYHQIGNCLVKLKNPTEAIHAYTQATADVAYASLGTVYCNLGMAYASLRDYDNAVRCFQAAIDDLDYPTPHKAYSGMGNALMKLGKTAEAGVAFREAALDESNADPTKALLNLGVCFMALNRPADAVASYESALQFDMDSSTRNKLNASLGQAYVSCGNMEFAVEAFESAIADRTYALSDSAAVDYQRAVAAVAQGASEATQVLPIADMSGLDVGVDGSVYPEDDYYDDQDPFYYDAPYDEENYPGYVDADEQGEDIFFNASDEELEQWSKDMAKKDRKRRNVGLKILVFVIVLIIALCAGAVFAYTQGYGYPTQQMVVEQLFADPQAAKSEVFVESLAQSSIDEMVDPVVQDVNVVIDGINQSMSESTVFATATTPEGGDVTYEVTMVRDMIGWKVSGIEPYFVSQN